MNGVKQQRVDGMSMLSTFASASAPSKRTTQYFEMMGNRAIYTTTGWRRRAAGCCRGYSRSRQHDAAAVGAVSPERGLLGGRRLARQYPDKLKQLQTLFDEEAKKNQVYPLDPRTAVGGSTHRRGSTLYSAQDICPANAGL